MSTEKMARARTKLNMSEDSSSKLAIEVETGVQKKRFFLFVFVFGTSCEIAKKVQGKIVYDPREGKDFDQFFQKQHFIHAIICHHVCE